MTKVIVSGFSVSIDGFGAGPEQSLESPLGKRGEELHEWQVRTRAFRQIHGESGGSEGVDSDYVARFGKGVGAFILGRNTFGPMRDAWLKNDKWSGWWGGNPPYHAPTFILTHHGRESIVMAGGTTFHFVTDGIEAALKKATAEASGKKVQIIGGVATMRQYLLAGLIDEFHFAVTPILLGRGEAMFAGLDLPALGYGVAEHASTKAATHIVLRR